MTVESSKDSAALANKMVEPAMKYLLTAFKDFEISVVLTDNKTPGCLLFTTLGVGESARKYLSGKITEEDPLGYVTGSSKNGNVSFNEEEH